MTRSLPALAILTLVSISLLMTPSASAEQEHFHPKGKPPSKHTKKILEQARAALPFADKRDFEEQQKGFIAAPKSRKIMADAGHALRQPLPNVAVGTGG